MSRRHSFRVIDSHTGGNPTRLVLSGVPPLLGANVAEKMKFFEAHHDWIRTAMVLEPRGGNLTSSAVLVPPSDPRADIGVFFMEAFGYLPMCGSDTIGLVTMLVESGQVPISGAETVVRIETPAGLIEATAHVVGDVVEKVTFVNVPAYVAALDTQMNVPGFGSVVVDVAYGGNFYVIADARQFGLTLDAHATAPALAAAGPLLAAANTAVDARLPGNPAIRGITHVQFFEPSARPDADARIMVIIEPGIVDRSPCGTGTTAKVATLVQRGVMTDGDTFTHESVTGQTFTGCALGDVDIAGSRGHRVAITGSAYITAESTVIVDSRDPLGAGFFIG